MVSIEYLDEERKKIWLEINQLKDDLDKKSSDHEKDAKQASRKCSEYKNRSLEAKDIISDVLKSVESKVQNINSYYEKLEKELARSSEVAKKAELNNEQIDSVISKNETISNLFDNRDELQDKLDNLSEILNQGQDSSNKITALYNSILKRKSELDELFYEINGYEEKNETTGEESHINGLKDDLELAYNELENNIESLKKDIIKINTDASNQYHLFLESKKESFQNSSEAWTEEYSQLSQKIKDLLPDALTAGLSHAFSKKKEDEIVSGKVLSRTFYLSIIGLVIVSLLPFSVNMYLLNNGKTIESVIYDMPRMVISILPLYIPFLWLAYSSNKKVNLSKRLVEEYTHKEVLSKTYEGLSSQIENLPESSVSAELRTKLLFNILDVSSENPGKLISDYNKADHPLMDALDKSTKLTNTINSLVKIPGFTKLASVLERKSNEILHSQSMKVNEALNLVTESEKEKPKTESV